MEHVLNLTNPGKTGLLKRQTIKYCCNSALEKTFKNMHADIFVYFLKCSIRIRKYFKQTKKQNEIFTSHINHTLLLATEF